MLFANTAKAADELIVAGVTVNTSATGIQTISSSAIQKLDPSKSVLVAYIPTQKKLGFKNAKIVNTAASGTNVIVQSNIAGLTIAIEDSCFLGVSRGVPMAVTANTTIEGYGTQSAT